MPVVYYNFTAQLKDLSDYVHAIAGPMTQRTLENLRRWGEDMFVKSTAQGATPEEQAAFSPLLIAQAHETAKLDNAKMIVSWAKAIYDEVQLANSQLSEIQKIQGYLATEKDKLAFVQRDAGTTPQVIQTIKANILSFEQDLRDLQQPQASVSGHPPPQGHAGTQFPGRDDLDGNLPPVP